MSDDDEEEGEESADSRIIGTVYVCIECRTPLQLVFSGTDEDDTVVELRWFCASCGMSADVDAETQRGFTGG